MTNRTYGTHDHAFGFSLGIWLIFWLTMVILTALTLVPACGPLPPDDAGAPDSTPPVVYHAPPPEPPPPIEAEYEPPQEVVEPPWSPMPEDDPWDGLVPRPRPEPLCPVCR